MAGTYRVTHCFQGGGGTTQDMYCNQFYFWSSTHNAVDVASWGGILAAYVHNLFVSTTGGLSISRYYAGRCIGNGGVTKIYDQTASGGVIPPAGAPIYQISDDALVPSADYLADCDIDTQPLPEEVAVCLSYQAIHTDGNLPRRRGRIYLGPLNVLAIDAELGHAGPTQVSGVFIDTILGAAQQVQSAAASNDFHWRVFSTMDGFAFDIINFSVDNAFDTIRGRGGAPTIRTTVPTL